MTPVLLITFLIFSVYDEAVSEPNDLYQQMKNLNASCFPLDSCRNFIDPRDDHLWNGRKCECGLHCVRFQTCCADSDHVLEKLPLSLPEQERCQKLEYFSTHVMMVSQCDSNWHWPSNITEKCDKSNYNSNDWLLTNIPVTNVKTRTTYKNYYCALCNNNEKNVLFWSIDLNTNYRLQLANNLLRYRTRKSYVLNSIKYNNQRKSYMFLDESNGEKFGIDIRYVLPVYLRKIVKPCYADLIETCKPSRSRTLMKQECPAYYSPVKVETQEKTIMYKNIHCLMCNNVNTSLVKVSSCMAEATVRAEGRRRSSAFNNLIHFDPVVEFPIYTACEKNTHYDTSNKCLKLTCANEGYVVVNGVCVPDCGVNAWFDTDMKYCRNLVCSRKRDVIQDGRCVRNCGVNSKWDPYFRRCKRLLCAIPGTVLENGQCVPDCGMNSYFNLEFKECRKLGCEKQDYVVKNGLCVPRCGVYEKYDPVSDTCNKIACLIMHGQCVFTETIL